MGAQKQIPTLILAVALSVSAFAQVSITGQIRGTVTDASGALVPDVRVTATSPALMAARVSVTQKDGSYLLEQLPPGTYVINFAAPNFTGYLQRGIVLTPGFTATINPTLQVGQIEQSVEVTSDAPVVDVKGNETATTFDASLLQGIPSGRDTWSTVEQAPGTTPDRFDVAGNQSFQQSVLEVHGSQPGEQVYSFNGLRMNWPGSSGGFTAFYVDNDALQEFQVVSDNAPPAGGGGGRVMNMW